LNTLLDHSRAAGLQKIFLGTTDKFLSAHRFYEKHGFQRTEIAELPIKFPRMAVDTIFYQYNL
jgi:N-acetylglutamate synthase-like GNAT family acetyltransferase